MVSYGVELFTLYFSHMFPEPSLTPESLSTVLDSMDDDLWYTFGRYINLSSSETTKIVRQFSSDRECKQALIPYLITAHPALSWRLVANALYKMGYQYGGVSCHRALDCLQQLFPTGNSCVYQGKTTSWVHNLRGNLHYLPLHSSLYN